MEIVVSEDEAVTKWWASWSHKMEQNEAALPHLCASLSFTERTFMVAVALFFFFFYPFRKSKDWFVRDVVAGFDLAHLGV